MLTVLQYLALLAAFFLPWTIGGMVKFQKQGDAKKRNLCALFCGVCVLLFVLVLVTAFLITPV
ncbi:MAG: hypothetical protein IJC71_06475 [Clostridia bacterium]|nr:hypothetical protein [Clostridia bacterium]